MPVRYVVAGEHLMCFDDDGLRSVPDGQRVSATVGAIACGPPLVTFDVTVREMAPEQVDMASVGELLENVMRSVRVAGLAALLRRQAGIERRASRPAAALGFSPR